MPALAAKLQVSNSPKIVVRVPVMCYLVHKYVHDKSDTFRWDHDGLVKAMDDVTNTSRRDVVSAEEELKARESEWKERWDETTLDLMWHMFNGVVTKHAMIYQPGRAPQ